jgi:hypothetical protein
MNKCFFAGVSARNAYQPIPWFLNRFLALWSPNRAAVVISSIARPY